MTHLHTLGTTDNLTHSPPHATNGNTGEVSEEVGPKPYVLHRTALSFWDPKLRFCKNLDTPQTSRTSNNNSHSSEELSTMTLTDAYNYEI